jgi:hypothetical protein
MRVSALLCIVVTQAWTLRANVEKTVFLAPSPVTLPHEPPSLDTLRLDVLDPADLSILATSLPVQFPSSSAPRGLESWYLLRALDGSRRYEVRICWPATVSLPMCLDAFCVPTLLADLWQATDRLLARHFSYNSRVQHPRPHCFARRLQR